MESIRIFVALANAVNNQAVENEFTGTSAITLVCAQQKHPFLPVAQY
jgi:hypothetical protein